ncbi:MAG: DUF86 domain-containing protein [Deltaproteobacteria bacterium]|nr:DUF86 domain-containing protein [Deltaproteobacteria bacterium]
MKRDRAYFTDILLSARSIMELTGDRPFEDFFSDTVAFSAVLYRFIIMGEATKRISMESKAAHPEVDWRGMAGQRDVVVHQYDGIDEYELWTTIQTNVPIVVRQMEQILENWPED